MKIKCPYCGDEKDYIFLGTLWKGLIAKCQNCGKRFEFHIEQGFLKEDIDEELSEV